MDVIDPRIFLIMPEHISNANNLWNCALFLTQISNLEAMLNNTTTTTKISQSNSSSNLAQQSTDNLDLLNDSTQNSIMNLRSGACDDESLLKHVNETIMKIYKIKRRNKASLFNLILPFDFEKRYSGSIASNSLPWVSDEDDPEEDGEEENNEQEDELNLTDRFEANEGCKRFVIFYFQYLNPRLVSIKHAKFENLKYEKLKF